MYSNQRNKSSLCKLAQIKAAFSIESGKRKKCIENILAKDGDISYRNLKSNYLKFHNSTLHGATALHVSFLHKDIELFETLLNKGCNCTIQNNNGSTVLHLAYNDYIYSINNYHQADENKIDPFINSILSMQIETRNFANPPDSRGLTHFHIACTVNHSKAVKFFLQHCSNEIVDQAVNDSYNRPGYTALHFAVLYCCTETVGILLEHGANIHIKDAEGMTPLHLIVDRNVHDVPFPNQARFSMMVEYFLKDSFHAESITEDSIGLSAFHIACILSDHCLVEKLLSKVKNINHAVKFESSKWPGFTALHFAMRCCSNVIDNIETIKLLLKNGADVQVKSAKRMTPFDVHFTHHWIYASEDLFEIFSSMPALKDLLLSDGTTKLLEVFSIIQHPEKVDDFIKTIGKNVDIFVPKAALLFAGYTLLHLAVLYSRKNSDVIKKILNSGADVTAQDARGWTPIHLAFRSSNLPIVELLIEYHPENINPTDEEQLSHLHIACQIGSESAVEKLLKRNTNVNISYQGPTLSYLLHKGSSPLHVAVNRRNREIVSKLLVHGANLYARDARNMTPIHQFVTFTSNFEIKELLLSSPNLRNSVTPCCKLHHLHVAAMIGDVSAVKKLLKRKVNVEARISCKQDRHYNPECPNSTECPNYCDGYTALHMAMRYKHYKQIDVVKLLIEYGAANIFAKKLDGSAPIYDAFSDSICPEYFIELLKCNKYLQNYAKKHSGLTMLHLACYNLDKNWVQELLENGDDVNAQISAKSPIWKKYTPLHVLLILYGSHSGWNNRNDDDIDAIFKLLLSDYRADVTLRNAKQDTPLHVAYANISLSFADEVRIWRVRMLLHYLENYQQNPVGSRGISHFHIACCFHNIDTIQQFLNYGKGVNQATDYFSYCPGYTMLHMALAGLSLWHLFTYDSLAETVRVLVESGADVNAEDSNGDTPVHHAAKSHFGFRKELFEILIAAGADINAMNIRGETPIEISLRQEVNSKNLLEFLYENGCNLNKFNSITQIGYMAITYALRTNGGIFSSTLNSLDAIAHKPHLTAADQYGRTAIHNIVSIPESSNIINEKTYTAYIKRLSEITGSDIDDQDNEGRTALHYATQFSNNKAVSALLNAGADINIIDNNGNSPFTCSLQPCSDSVNCQRHEEHFHETVIKTFQSHVRKLEILRLDINKANEQALNDSCLKFRDDIDWLETVTDELTKAKIEKIDGTLLFLKDFLYESKAIAAYGLMYKSQCRAIDCFFEKCKLEKFSELECLFRLQYRKAVKKSKLIKRDRASLRILVGFTLPVTCEDRILSFLTSVELDDLITLAIRITQS